MKSNSLFQKRKLLKATSVPLIFFGLFLGHEWTDASSASPSPSVKSSPTAQPSVLPSDQPSPQASPSITPLASDPKELLKEFQKAQYSEKKALEHRQKLEFKSFQTAQDTKYKEWDLAEKQARYRFFESHIRGPDRRAYIQDFLRRRDVLRKQLADEKAHRIQENENAQKHLKEEHAQKLKEFKKALDQKVTPSLDLWPKTGY